MMDSGQKMAWSSSSSARGWAVLAGLLCLGMPTSGEAQVVTAEDRTELIRMRTAQGGTAEEVDALIRQATEAAARGLPGEPLANKIREGLAKGVEPKRIEPVLRQLTTHLESADQLVTELGVPHVGTGRTASVTLLAESMTRGVTPEEVRELHRHGQSGRQPLSSESLASAAKSLSLMKEAKVPSQQGAAVVNEAVRQGYRSNELLELGREVKRRSGDVQTGRMNLQVLREGIARGDHPERLFRDDSGGHGGGGSRIERGERSGSGRSEHVERPERSSKPERPERPERPDRSGGGRDH